MTNITYLSLVTLNMILFLNLRQKNSIQSTLLDCLAQRIGARALPLGCCCRANKIRLNTANTLPITPTKHRPNH